MCTKLPSFMIALLMPLLLPRSVLADGIPGYFGFGAAAADSSIHGVKDSTALRLYGGLMFSDDYGVEAGYVDFGKFDVKNAARGNYVEARGPYVALAGFNMVSSRVELTGKLGALHYDQNVESEGSRVSSDNGTSPMLAVGANFYLNRGVAVGAEFMHLTDVESEHINSGWVLLQLRPGAGRHQSP